MRWRGAAVAQADLARLFRDADAVVHLAWAPQPARRPAQLEAVNVEGTGRVLDAVRRAEVPALICASSGGACSLAPKGNGTTAPAAGEMWSVDETWPTNGIPTSLYGRQKAKVEHMRDAFEQSVPGTRVVRLRKALVLKREAASEIARLFLGKHVPLRLLAHLPLPILPVPTTLW
jgi:nucleoside-diphosphate-sugar epimerase